MKRVTTAGATVALVLATVLVQPAVGSASPAPPGSAARTGVPAAPSSGAAARAASRLPVPLSGGAYVYTDGNTCPNDIDVFKVEGSQLSEVQQLTVGCSAGTTFGTHYLLVAGAGSCLVFSDDGDGQVDTFTIDPTTGELSSTPVSTVDVGGRPGDLTAIGSTIVESNTGLATLDTFSLGSGCALTLLKQNSTGSQDDTSITSERSYVLTADQNSNAMYAYQLEAGGTLTQVDTAAGQIVDPQGIAMLGSKVYTGQVTGSAPQTQGYATSKSGMAPLAGSPGTDGNPSAEDGPAVATWAGGLVFQAETLTSGVAWYAADPLSYGGDVTLPAGVWPSQLAVAGNNLLAVTVAGGDLDACAVTAGGLSSCRLVATLTGGSGASVAVKA